MGIFGKVEEMSDAIRIAEKLVPMAERAINIINAAYHDSGVKEQFEQTGNVDMEFSIAGYKINIGLADLRKTAIAAEISEEE